MSETTHRQHYVPCTYLKWFSNDPSKWRESIVAIYDGINKKNREANVWSVMYENNFYNINRKNLPVDFLEDLFNQTFESWLSTIIEKINKKEQISLTEINQICSFISFQEFRTRYRYEWIEKTFEDLKTKGIKIDQKEVREQFFQNMFCSNNIIWSKLRWTKWYIWHSNNWDFITSDHPLYLCKPNNHPENMTIWIYSASLCFPLSKHSYLVAKHWEQDLPNENNWKKEITYSDCDNTLTKILNNYSCRDIYRFIIGKNLNSLSEVISILNWEK